MLRTVHTAPAGRIVAAILAIALSGAPALAIERSGAVRPAKHRCQCPPRPHDCSCPVCRSAVRQARRARVAELPQCHRARALEELARDEAEESRRAAGSAPCLRSSCDGPEERHPTPAGHDVFVLPAGAGVGGQVFVTRIRAPAAALLSRAREPETPPPRGA